MHWSRETYFGSNSKIKGVFLLQFFLETEVVGEDWNTAREKNQMSKIDNEPHAHQSSNSRKVVSAFTVFMCL